MSWKAKGKNHELGWDTSLAFVKIAVVTPHREGVKDSRQQRDPGREQGNGERFGPRSREGWTGNSCGAQVHCGAHSDNCCMVWPHRLPGPPLRNCGPHWDLKKERTVGSQGCGQRLSERLSSRWRWVPLGSGE